MLSDRWQSHEQDLLVGCPPSSRCICKLNAWYLKGIKGMLPRISGWGPITESTIRRKIIWNAPDADAEPSLSLRPSDHQTITLGGIPEANWKVP